MAGTSQFTIGTEANCSEQDLPSVDVDHPDLT